MKNNGANRSPLRKALGLVGVLGMAGAIMLIGPLAGSGCNEDNTSGATNGNGGHGGTTGIGGHGGVTGAGGGGGSAVDAGGDGSVSPTATNVTTQNFAYMPATFTVAPGASIVVHNTDTMPHTMTSEAATNDATPGGVNGVSFDTGPIAPGATATITIPANAPSGTMVPFYCTIHGRVMQGMLTIQ